MPVHGPSVFAPFSSAYGAKTPFRRGLGREILTPMSIGVAELYPVTQLMICAALGAVLAVLLPSRLTPSRWSRAIEGAANAVLFGFLFLLGSGRLGVDETDVLPVVAACVGVVLYLCSASLMTGRWPRREQRSAGK
jgi:hypothetical protein